MFKNMKLALKIGGGFAVIMILAAAVAIIGWLGLLGVADSVEKADDATQIVASVLEIRLAEKNFIISGETSYADEVRKDLETLGRDIMESRAKLKDPLDQQRIDNIVETAGGYAIRFEDYVSLRAQRDIAEGKMVKAAEATKAQAEEVLQEMMEEYNLMQKVGADTKNLSLKAAEIEGVKQVIVWTLEARRNEKNFIMRGINEYRDNAEGYMKNVMALAEQIKANFTDAHRLEQADNFLKYGEEYIAGFEEYVVAETAMESAETKMVESARSGIDLAAEARVVQKGKMEAKIKQSTVLMVGGIIIAVLFGIILAFVITLSITRAMKKGVEFAEAVAAGRLDVDLDLDQKDEIGMLANSLKKMLESFKYKAGAIRVIADGDLRNRIEKASNDDGLGQSLIDMSESLNELLGQVAISVEQVSSGSDQVSQASQALSQGATEQASSLEEISSSINEINSQSKQNAENASEANALAKTTGEVADQGNRQVQGLVEAMKKVNTSSDEIKKIVKVIDDIAFQTNLLALNANVEAARAGKYGKGFAVVAEEVRNLAARSAEAAKETTTMVEESIKNVEEGTSAANGTANQLEEIVAGFAKVVDFLGEIALASKEQAQGVEQINSGLEQIDQVTQSNTASAEQSASAAEELSSQALQLKGLISRFKLRNNGSGNGKKEVQSFRSVSEQKENGTLGGSREPVGAIAVNTGTDTNNGRIDPKEVINLDDDDFGRF